MSATNEPGQRAYEAWHAARYGFGESVNELTWNDLTNPVRKAAWAAVEQACAVPAPEAGQGEAAWAVDVLDAWAAKHSCDPFKTSPFHNASEWHATSTYGAHRYARSTPAAARIAAARALYAADPTLPPPPRPAPETQGGGNGT